MVGAAEPRTEARTKGLPGEPLRTAPPTTASQVASNPAGWMWVSGGQLCLCRPPPGTQPSAGCTGPSWLLTAGSWGPYLAPLCRVLHRLAPASGRGGHAGIPGGLFHGILRHTHVSALSPQLPGLTLCLQGGWGVGLHALCRAGDRGEHEHLPAFMDVRGPNRSGWKDDR